MSARLIKVNGRYVYFFDNYEQALHESNEFDDFEIYQYADSELFILGEKDALLKKRPHFYDWNGSLYPYSRLDSESLNTWRNDFFIQLKVYVCQLEAVAA